MVTDTTGSTHDAYTLLSQSPENFFRGFVIKLQQIRYVGEPTTTTIMDEIQKFIRQLRKWNWIVFGLALFTAMMTIAENGRLKREAERRAEYQALSERRLEECRNLTEATSRRDLGKQVELLKKYGYFD